MKRFIWMLAALLTVSTLTASTARAEATCPWGPVESAHATITTVTINGEMYLVRGLIARTAFRQALLACGEREAAYHFSSWRQMRRWTNVSFVAGFPSAGLFFVVAAVTALNANSSRTLMLWSLLPESDRGLPPGSDMASL
jgi:hypothetical protein